MSHLLASPPPHTQSFSHSLPIVPTSPSHSNLPSHVHQLCSASSSSMWLRKKPCEEKKLLSGFGLESSLLHTPSLYKEPVQHSLSGGSKAHHSSKCLFLLFLLLSCFSRASVPHMCRHHNTYSSPTPASEPSAQRVKIVGIKGSKDARKLFRVMEVFHILTVMIFTQLYTTTTFYQTRHLSGWILFYTNHTSINLGERKYYSTRLYHTPTELGPKEQEF